MIYINNILMPSPKSMDIKKEPIWSKNTSRTASGDMVGDIIAYKYNIDIVWPTLSASDVKKIENSITQSAFFNVGFIDPATNILTTKSFYAGTPTYPVYSYANGLKTYSGMSVTFIQQ